MNQNIKQILRIFGLVALGAMVLLVAACQKSTPISATSLDKGGAQLWAENCGRCHNIRSPTTLSDAEWDVATHHMRIRANLTGTETEEILTFLQSAN